MTMDMYVQNRVRRHDKDGDIKSYHKGELLLCALSKSTVSAMSPNSRFMSFQRTGLPPTLGGRRGDL